MVMLSLLIRLFPALCLHFSCAASLGAPSSNSGWLHLVKLVALPKQAFSIVNSVAGRRGLVYNATLVVGRYIFRRQAFLRARWPYLLVPNHSFKPTAHWLRQRSAS